MFYNMNYQVFFKIVNHFKIVYLNYVTLKIFCMTIKPLSLLDKLPSYITPFGLGEYDYPSHWMREKNGLNITKLNKYYGEATGYYWVWKNYLSKLNNDDWIGFCQYRRLWLDNLFKEKQKNNLESLYMNLLRPNNKIFSNTESILLQPTIFENQNLAEQFNTIYGKDIFDMCLSYINKKDQVDFENFLKNKKLSICNMFITKPKIFDLYCRDMFDLINKIYYHCEKHNLLVNKNIRLPIFMIERFTSFWFEKYTKVDYLSFARLGNFFLSEKLNKFLNPLKVPLTFRMYPTIHRY